MDAMAFWQANGKQAVEQLCAKAGTNYKYWKHIANRRKRPSVDLARRLVEHSGGALTLDELLVPREQLRVPAKS